MSTTTNDNATQTIDPEITKALRDINDTMLEAYEQIERANDLQSMPTAKETSTLVFNLLNLFMLFWDLFERLPEEAHTSFNGINLQAGFIRLVWCDDAISFLTSGVIPEPTPELAESYEGIEARAIDQELTIKGVIDNVAYALGVFANVYEGVALDALENPIEKASSHIEGMKKTLSIGVAEFRSLLDRCTTTN